MDSLSLHIEYLLTRHDCVIVPGFGAFIATESDGAFDEKNGLIIRRRRDISFNISVVTDDGLLSHSISRRERISYEEAHKKLVLMTARMKQELHLEGETNIGRVGKLVMDSEGMLTFRRRIDKAEEEIYSDLILPKAISESSITDDKTSESVAVTQTESGERIVRVPADRYVFTISKRLTHAAAIIAMALGICLSVLLPINHDMEQRASVMPLERLIRPLDKTIRETESKPDTIVTTQTCHKEMENLSGRKTGEKI